jgi:hypothetical protein
MGNNNRTCVSLSSGTDVGTPVGTGHASTNVRNGGVSVAFESDWRLSGTQFACDRFSGAFVTLKKVVRFRHTMRRSNSVRTAGCGKFFVSEMLSGAATVHKNKERLEL